MRKIANIDSNYIISLDIETVRIKEHFKDLPEEEQDSWEYKNKNNGEVPDNEVLAKMWADNASLYAEHSKVCAVSIAYLKKGVLRCKNYVSDSEVAILKELRKDLNMFRSVNPRYTLVGHAALFFDYPFLVKRYIINRMEIPPMLDESGLPPWERKLLCTNDIWRSPGTGAGASLQAICTAMKIPVSKVDLVGDGVGKAYFNGELVRIADYCNKDVVATFNVFRVFKRESIFQFEDVEYVNQGEVLEMVPFLSDIQKAKTITKEQAIEIDDFCKELSVSQIEIVRDILHAACVGKKGALPDEVATYLEKL